MKEGQVVFVALVVSVLGIAFLFLSARGIQPERVRISALGEEMSGRYVEVWGRIGSAYVRGGDVFLSLCEGDCVGVVVFERDARAMDYPNPYLLKKGDEVVVRGLVKIYKGEIEIVPFGGNPIELRAG
ncbi:MAG: hypothetical protein AB1468_01575 [Candidatus Micrarchaeota archaeon]